MSSLVMGIEIDCDHDLVPEWRYKYVDYNVGNRHIKGIARAVQQLNSNRPIIRVGNFKRSDKIKRCSWGVTASTNGRMSFFPTTDANDRKRTSKISNAHDEPTLIKNTVETPPNPNSTNIPFSLAGFASSKDENNVNSNLVNLSNPLDTFSNSKEINTSQEKTISINPISRGLASKGSCTDLSREPRKDMRSESRYDVQKEAHRDPVVQRVKKAGTASTIYSGHASPRTKEMNTFSRQPISPISPKSFNSDIFSNGRQISAIDSYQINNEITASEIVRLRQNDFVKWFEQELEKVDLFYKTKEDEAVVLLKKLREQLLEMRSRRVEELAEAQNRRESQFSSADELVDKTKPFNNQEIIQQSSGDWSIKTFFPARKFAVDFKDRLFSSFVGQNTRALQNIQIQPGSRTLKIAIDKTHPNIEGKEDCLARQVQYADQVPYRKAKRKLKLALLECFRGMNLLKSYTILNQLAFRKMVKKYNQAVGTNAPIINLSGKLSNAWFVKSDVLDNHLSTAVDLYARYFECGNQTIALVKLRGSIAPRADESAISFRNGAFIGIGTVFGILGLLKANELLNSPDPLIRFQTLSLMEIYAGYFLCLYLFAFFCFDCFIWTRNHINYQFIFEFDIGHALDWRKLPSVPSFLLTFLGFCMWINFSISEYSKIYVNIPLILIAATVTLIFLPAPILFHRGRRWFIYSNCRLLLAGLYPVEFRDFFLGDMYCSLTYVMANIELFFCLNLDHWKTPQKCGSSKSRLLGFFTTIPAVWRLLQCLRRYYDTRDIFPHLLNCAKYVTTVIYLTCLSIYRIGGTRRGLILFIISAVVNSSFGSVWDVFMDWSLMQPSAKDFLLRDVRGFRKSWWYYGPMILNPILRFVWILYTANLPVLGHSSKTSFFIAFAEVTRRGIWSIFRVENAHCSNVAQFKASHDLQLPYTTLVGPVNPVIDTEDSGNHSHLKPLSPLMALGPRNSSESTPQRRPLARLLSDAHTKDFEKRRQWGAGGISPRGPGNNPNDLDSEVESSSDNDGELDKEHKQSVLEV